MVIYVVLSYVALMYYYTLFLWFATLIHYGVETLNYC